MSFLRPLTENTATESSIPEDDSVDTTQLGPYYSKESITQRKKKSKKSDDFDNEKLVNVLQKSIDARIERESALKTITTDCFCCHCYHVLERFRNI